MLALHGRREVLVRFDVDACGRAGRPLAQTLIRDPVGRTGTPAMCWRGLAAVEASTCAAFPRSAHVPRAAGVRVCLTPFLVLVNILFLPWRSAAGGSPPARRPPAPPGPCGGSEITVAQPGGAISARLGNCLWPGPDWTGRHDRY